MTETASQRRQRLTGIALMCAAVAAFSCLDTTGKYLNHHMTTTEVVWQIVLPYTRVGVAGGILLGLGRALGETMAVTFVIGNAHRISASLFAPGTTISATIANEFTEADGDLYTSSLVSLGLILFIITFIILAIARYMLLRIDKRTGA